MARVIAGLIPCSLYTPSKRATPFEILKMKPKKRSTVQLPYEVIMQRFADIHGDTFSYDFTEYKNTRSCIPIICNICGCNFTRTAKKHFMAKNCPKCRYVISSSKIRFTVQEVQKRIFDIHGDIYDTSGIKYINVDSKCLEIKCRLCGDVFTCSFDRIVYTKRGCPCTYIHNSAYKGVPTYLYYLSVNNGLAYKIGITTKSVRERYNKLELENIKILMEELYEDGHEAAEKESWILNEFKAFKYTGNPVLNSGNTEMFCIDVLGLDVK